MPNNLTMYIGAKGIFTLEAPYNALMPTQIVYSVEGIRRISDIVASGLDPFVEYYEPNGITQEAYELDLQADINIVSLMSTGGDWLYVPSTAIMSYPDINGVSYTAMMLGISLGALPDTTSLAPLKTAISNMVRDYLGITPIVKEIVVSDSSLISYADHTTIETARAGVKTVDKSDAAKLTDMTAKYNALLVRVSQIEAYAKTLL